MNDKNSLGLNSCFMDLDDPLELFRLWMVEAEKSEINDPNALSLATANKNNEPSVRVVLLKGLSQKGFVFYTNLNSQKSNNLKENPKAEMCFHWKSLQRQIRIFGTVTQVTDKEADEYFNTRPYQSRIGAWASDQSKVMKNRDEFLKKIDEFKNKYKAVETSFKRAEYFVNVSCDALGIFHYSKEKEILQNLAEFSLNRSF